MQLNSGWKHSTGSINRDLEVSAKENMPYLSQNIERGKMFEVKKKNNKRKGWAAESKI